MASEEMSTPDVKELSNDTTPRRTVCGSSAGGKRRRTPFAASERLNSAFKSPLQSRSTPRCPAAGQSSVEEEVEGLKKRLQELDSEIAQLQTEGLTVEELDKHIDLLHEYNDIKDNGQMLLGRLATVRGVTTKDLYGEFGLDLGD
ncbi:DNA repair protein SWI5 homolog isoform X1 [Lepisosteus oculatus]|uniref:DNA repair protein SWI5 homolog isoform X1 n=1 Tax=Lepisosteus oculatus TaxID=7918 RepID=UPI0037174EAA